MDRIRFDALARLLAGSVSRRAAIKGAIAVMVSSRLLPSTKAAQQSEPAGSLPTLEPLPTEESPRPTPTVPSGPTARVAFQVQACPDQSTSYLIEGPVVWVKFPETCASVEGETFILTDSSGSSSEITTPVELRLPFGLYHVLHPATGLEAYFDVYPTERYTESCDHTGGCMFWWSIALFIDAAAQASTSIVDPNASQPAGEGSLEVHLADCPAGYRGPDFYNVCHNNGIERMEALLSTETVHQEASTVIEQSPGPGIARFGNLAPDTYGLNIRTKFVKAPAYVFCSPDQGVTVLVDEFVDDYHDPVLVPIYDQAVICDWLMLRD